MDVLGDLQKWYAANCKGDWKHSFKAVIETLDNPRWLVKIDLEETSFDGKHYQSFQRELSENQWLFCRVENNKFIGAGDETQLEEILKAFLSWAKSQNEDWLKTLTEEELQLLEDEQFLNLLGEEIGTECKYESCRHKQIKNSVMCRKHDFEMVQKRLFPENTS